MKTSSRVKSIKVICDRCKQLVEGIRGEAFSAGFYDMTKWEDYRRDNERYVVSHACLPIPSTLNVTALASERPSVTFIKINSTVLFLFVTVLLALSSCGSQSTALGRPPDEFEAIRECDRNVVGKQDAKNRTKSDYVYDTLGRRWLVAYDRAGE